MDDGCGFLPDSCLIDNQEQRFLSYLDDNFFNSACQLSNMAETL